MIIPTFGRITPSTRIMDCKLREQKKINNRLNNTTIINQSTIKINKKSKIILDEQ